MHTTVLAMLTALAGAAHLVRFLDHMSSAHAERTASAIRSALSSFFTDSSGEHRIGEYLVPVAYHADVYVDTVPEIISDTLSACTHTPGKMPQCVIAFLNAHSRSPDCTPLVIQKQWLHSTEVLAFLQTERLQSSKLALANISESLWSDFPPELCSALHAEVFLTLRKSTIMGPLGGKCFTAVSGIGLSDKLTPLIPSLPNDAFRHMAQPMSPANAGALSARQFQNYGLHGARQSCCGLPLAALKESTFAAGLSGDCLASFLEASPHESLGRNTHLVTPAHLRGQDAAHILNLMHAKDIPVLGAGVWGLVSSDARIYTLIDDGVPLPSDLVVRVAPKDFPRIKSAQIVRQAVAAPGAPADLLSHATADFLSARGVDILALASRETMCGMVTHMSTRIPAGANHGCALIDTAEKYSAVSTCTLPNECLASIPLSHFFNDLAPSVRPGVHPIAKEHGLPPSFLGAYTAQSWVQHALGARDLLPHQVAQLPPGAIGAMTAADVPHMPLGQLAPEQMAALSADAVAGIADWTAVDPQCVAMMGYANFKGARVSLLSPAHIAAVATAPSVRTARATISMFLSQWDALGDEQRAALERRARVLGLPVPQRVSDFHDSHASASERATGSPSPGVAAKLVLAHTGDSAPVDGGQNSTGRARVGGVVSLVASLSVAVGYAGYRRGRASPT